MEPLNNLGEVEKDSILHRKRNKNKFLATTKCNGCIDAAATSILAPVHIKLTLSVMSAKLKGSGCMNCRVRISTCTKNHGDDCIESEYVLLLKLRTEQF